MKRHISMTLKFLITWLNGDGAGRFLFDVWIGPEAEGFTR